MLAEGVHSLADSGNQLLLLLGGRKAQEGRRQRAPLRLRPRALRLRLRRVDHPVLASAACSRSTRASRSCSDPHPLDVPWLPVARARRSRIGLEGFSLRTAVKESNHVRGTQSWAAVHPPRQGARAARRAARGRRRPARPRASPWSASASRCITGNGVFDAIGTLAIGVLLVAVAVVLGIETKSLLVGEGATAGDVAAIRAAITAGPEVESIIHMKTLYLGPDELLVARQGRDAPAAPRSATWPAPSTRSRHRVRAAVPVARVIYIEPDVWVGAGPGRPVDRRDRHPRRRLTSRRRARGRDRARGGPRRYASTAHRRSAKNASSCARHSGLARRRTPRRGAAGGGRAGCRRRSRAAGLLVPGAEDDARRRGRRGSAPAHIEARLERHDEGRVGRGASRRAPRRRPASASTSACAVGSCSSSRSLRPVPMTAPSRVEHDGADRHVAGGPAARSASARAAPIHALGATGHGHLVRWYGRLACPSYARLSLCECT